MPEYREGPGVERDAESIGEALRSLQFLLVQLPGLPGLWRVWVSRLGEAGVRRGIVWEGGIKGRKSSRVEVGRRRFVRFVRGG